MFDDKTKYPLCWPETWPRTAPAGRQRSRFGLKSVPVAFDFLRHEMERLGTKSWFMSSNVARGARGQPNGITRQPLDTGVAAYFNLNGKPISLACDKWDRVEDNIWALAKHIEALRGQERWGVGSVEQAFRGYMALPGIGEAGGIKWWEVLGVPINSTTEQVRDAYRILVKKHHPDINGERELFERVQAAWEIFQTTAQ